MPRTRPIIVHRASSPLKCFRGQVNDTKSNGYEILNGFFHRHLPSMVSYSFFCSCCCKTPNCTARAKMVPVVWLVLCRRNIKMSCKTKPHLIALRAGQILCRIALLGILWLLFLCVLLSEISPPRVKIFGRFFKAEKIINI